MKLFNIEQTMKKIKTSYPKRVRQRLRNWNRRTEQSIRQQLGLGFVRK